MQRRLLSPTLALREQTARAEVGREIGKHSRSGYEAIAPVLPDLLMAHHHGDPSGDGLSPRDPTRRIFLPLSPTNRHHQWR